jgi:hypothetical protein
VCVCVCVCVSVHFHKNSNDVRTFVVDRILLGEEGGREIPYKSFWQSVCVALLQFYSPVRTWNSVQVKNRLPMGAFTRSFCGNHLLQDTETGILILPWWANDTCNHKETSNVKEYIVKFPHKFYFVLLMSRLVSFFATAFLNPRFWKSSWATDDSRQSIIKH